MILDKKLFNFIVCYGQMESSEITSTKISSTLNLVELLICFRLSR